MAKNFTDFQEIVGSYTPPSPDDGVTPGSKTTQANTNMYLVGYDTDTPGGERRYTIDSVLLAASKHHVGLENVDNESKAYMFNDSVFTGESTADNLTIHGNLTVEGTQVTLNTTIAATSAIKINNYGTNPALEVVQTGPDDVVNFYHNDTDLAFNINQFGKVGINVVAPEQSVTIDPNQDPVGIQLQVKGNTHIDGDLFVGAINGIYIAQDHDKLTDIQNRADITSLNLSNVSQRLTELQNTSEYSDVTVAKGFDLLEDGDTYKKIPIDPEDGTTWDQDYSTTKIMSIEYDADVTANHSADITYNLVPDGPWTGDLDTSFVKMTSAENIRLNDVRGVDRFLTGVSDTGEDITAQHIVQAYQNQYPNFWSTSDEDEYRNIVLPKLNSVRTTTHAYSADWQSVTSHVNSLSDSWEESVDITAVDQRVDAIIQTVAPVSADWNSTRTTTNTYSADWQSVTSDVNATSGDWNSTRTTTNTYSADWQSVTSDVNATSATWNKSVHNRLDDQGEHQGLDAGTADMITVVTEGLTATQDARFKGTVYMLHDGVWKQGQTVDIPLGEDTLRFVDGVLVEWLDGSTL